ncbi:hypothetical protein DRQ27_01755, partial [bacterium]
EALLLSPKDCDALLLKAKILTELGKCEQAAKIIKSLPTAIPSIKLSNATDSGCAMQMVLSKSRKDNVILAKLFISKRKLCNFYGSTGILFYSQGH